MKVLILVLSCDDPAYNYIREEGIAKTWDSSACEGTEVYYYFGNAGDVSVDSNRINLTTSEDLMSIGVRTLECFEYCLDNFDFDYIYRTNLSSYVNKERLLKFLEGRPSTSFYSAVVGHHVGVSYGSGAGYFLSRDLVEEVVSRKEELDTSILDDVAIGKLLNKYFITPAPRVDLPCYHTTLQGLISIPEVVCDENDFHFRCKCESNRQGDVYAMKEVHKKFEG